MFRNSAHSIERSTHDDNEQPTRRVPVFDLAAESRRLDEARARARVDEDATVTIGAEENKRLLASVFASGEDLAPQLNTDDEPTLDAPAPVLVNGVLSEPTFPARPVRVTARAMARPPALRALVLTSAPPVAPPRSAPRLAVAPEAIISLEAVPSTLPRPAALLVMPSPVLPPAPVPAAFAPVPSSGLRRRITPQLARTARDLREAGERRRSEPPAAVRTPKRDPQTLVVAGIWAMALSLIAMLMFMATSA